MRFGGVAALSDVSFAVEPGTVHALIGPNGAGKSTCINVLGGAYRATEGRVTYGDGGTHRAARAPDRRRWAWPAPSRTSRSRSRTPSRTTCWSAGTA